MTGGEDLAVGAFFQHPLATLVAHAIEVRGESHPVEVHVQRQGSRRGAVREAPLLLAYLGKVHAEAAELLGDRHLKVAGLLQLIEVLLEETVIAVVSRGSLSAVVQDRVRQNGVGRNERSHRLLLVVPGNVGGSKSSPSRELYA